MRDEKAWKWVGEHQLGYDIWEKKYRHNNETFDQWLDRVSGGNTDVRKLIEEKKFLFGGRILANRGVTDRKVTYSNCYVMNPPEDNLESIFQCASDLARTYSYGGGCGIDLSKLRPKGAITNNAAKESTGPVSFMDIYSQVTGTISQSGRRGALMVSLDVRHPDIEEFIDCKTDLNRVNYANISVRVNDEFMKAVESDSDYLLTWPCNSDLSSSRYCSMWPAEYNILAKIGDVYVKKIKAKQLFQKLAENNWNYAEPGILYWDTMENHNLLNTNKEFKYSGINPCGELPMNAGSSCLLGSINLSEFVVNPFTKDAYFDTDALDDVVSLCVKALNEVLEEGKSLHPLQYQQTAVDDWKFIGLGTFGLADALIKLGIKYGHDAKDIITEIYSCIAASAILESVDLAKEFGCYPKCDKESLSHSKFMQGPMLDLLDSDFCNDLRTYGIRNGQLLTCPPTGSIATMIGTSTGLEPLFALSYNRTTKSLNGEDTVYKVDAPIVKLYKEITGNETLPDYFVDSSTIHYTDRIAVQAQIQEYTDGSLSSTCNIPEDTTVDQVFDLYMQAWKSGCKGTTIFRNNCARIPILSTSEKKEESKELQRGEIIKAGDNCIGLKRTLMTGCGSLHLQAFFNPETGELLETYLSKGSQGGCNNFMIGLSRMMSLAARGGIKIESILDQLKSCGTCPSYAVRKATKGDVSLGSCCPTAVGNALKDMHKEVLERIQCCEPVKSERQEKVIVDTKNKCPECGAELEFSGGCNSCPSCGFSKCS